MLYRSIVKPLLFLLPPETAHSVTVKIFRFLLSIPIVNTALKHFFSVEHDSLRGQFMGLNFSNRIGLAAGFDKDGRYFHEMAALGFGFIELGTVTPKPQIGNPKPRLFRLPLDEAIINRMGFNNQGVDQLVEQLKKGKPNNLIIGGNIGKNKTTPNEHAIDDYVYCFEKLFRYVDYFVVNVSSPNTPNLRALQEKEPLQKLLEELQKRNHQKDTPKPILLKIAPDLTDTQLDDIVEIVSHTKLDGVIATNTTIDRNGLVTSNIAIQEIGNGGLSGKCIANRSNRVIRYLSNKTDGEMLIVGVGGINSPETAQEKLDAGAHLLQIYTGLIYEGPGLVKKINTSFLKN